MISKMNKRQKSLLEVYLIVLIAFVVVFLVIPFCRNTAVIMQFFFGIVAICLGYGITCYAFKNTDTVKSKFYGMPVAYIGWIYTGIQIVFSFLIFIVNLFIKMPAWIGVVISIILLAATLIGVIGAESAREMIEDIDNKEEIITKTIKSFRLDIASLCDDCNDENVKEHLVKLADKLQYSDPVSSETLADIEYRITQGIKELIFLVEKSDYANAVEKIKIVERMVDDRNRRCKAEKR